MTDSDDCCHDTNVSIITGEMRKGNKIIVSYTLFQLGVISLHLGKLTLEPSAQRMS